MDDVRAARDAVGSKRAALLGYSEGGSYTLAEILQILIS
jgi:hypothetical protein